MIGQACSITIHYRMNILPDMNSLSTPFHTTNWSLAVLSQSDCHCAVNIT